MLPAPRAGMKPTLAFEWYRHHRRSQFLGQSAALSPRPSVRGRLPRRFVFSHRIKKARLMVCPVELEVLLTLAVHAFGQFGGHWLRTFPTGAWRCCCPSQPPESMTDPNAVSGNHHMV